MANDLVNATFLDGPAGWSSSGAVTVDEATRGSPGRAVLVANGPIRSAAVALNGAAVVHAFAHHAPGARLLVRFLDGAGQGVGDVVLPRVTNPPGSIARRGLPSTFAFSRGAASAPGGAVSYQLVTQDAAPNLLLKPYAGRSAVCGWLPGPHANPDLQLAVWPETAGQPTGGSWRATPTGARIGFESDSRIPVTSQVATEPWVTASFTLTLDLAARDDLDVFWRATQRAPFWFVRPDTHQLCRAWWLEDGDPADSGMGRARRTEVGLLLEPT